MTTPTMVTINGLLVPVGEATEVYFRVPVPVRYNADPSVFVPYQYKATAAVDGSFTLQVPGTDDPAWSPTNWTYKVTVVGPNLNFSFNAQVPYNAGSLNFSSILPSLPASEGTLYAAYNHTHLGLCLVLGPTDPVPPGTLAGTPIIRTS
jgi:hypothetical protein